MLNCSVFGRFSLLYAYQWPVKPFNSQHPVNDVLDACRGSRDHFHDGIDIGEPTGIYVFASESGWSHDAGSQSIYVGDHQYLHINRWVGNDIWITAGVDTLGTINNENHLHFTDGPNGSESNPLAYGRLSPFSDDADPTVDEIYLIDNWNEDTRLDPYNVSGKVDIVVKAHDAITDGGSNAGVYTIYYSVDDPYHLTKNYSFDWWFSCPVSNIYAPGSGTSTFKYKVTNSEWSDGYVDCDQLSPGWHTIYVEAQDIKGNYSGGSLNFYVLSTGLEDLDLMVQDSFALYQNHPNPFSEQTTISYQLPVRSKVSLVVYNITGQVVKILIDEVKEPGYYKVVWDGRDSAGQKVGDGVYFCRFYGGSFKAIKKVIKIR